MATVTDQPCHHAACSRAACRHGSWPAWRSSCWSSCSSSADRSRRRRSGRRGATTTPAPSADRVRDYQDRCASPEARRSRRRRPRRNRRLAHADGRLRRAGRRGHPRTRLPRSASGSEYESLFASNVVLSRRPEAETAGRRAGLVQPVARTPRRRRLPRRRSMRSRTPSFAPRRARPADTRPFRRSRAPTLSQRRAAAATDAETPSSDARVDRADSQRWSGAPAARRHLIDTVLTNRSMARRRTGELPRHEPGLFAQRPARRHSRRRARARRDEARAGARRAPARGRVPSLAACRTAARIRLDQFLGLNQIGDAGLRTG